MEDERVVADKVHGECGYGSETDPSCDEEEDVVQTSIGCPGRGGRGGSVVSTGIGVEGGATTPVLTVVTRALMYIDYRLRRSRS